MPRQSINGVELHYKLIGDGDPLVLVHGSWTDHTSWQFVAPRLAESHRVLSYDRRGHSRSERPMVPWTRRQDEDDLAAMIESLDLAPAHLVANSYGGNIALALAARRPELVRTVSAHEPALHRVAAPGSTVARQVVPILATMEAVVADIRRDDAESATARFMNHVALGPGAWDHIPIEARRMMVANAPTWVVTFADRQWGAVPVPSDVPVLLTDGDASPPWLPAIVAALAATTYDRAGRHTFGGAGHNPHFTHPDAYVEVIRAFVDQSSADATAGAGIAA